MKTICVISQKGGVGKTTLTIQLASALDTAVIADTDPQQSVQLWFHARASELTSPYVAGVFAEALPRFIASARSNGAEHIYIVTSPNSSETTLAIADQADLLIVPCGPSFLDLRALQRTENIVRLSGKPALAVLNLCPAYGSEADQAEEALKRLGFPVARTRIGNRAAARQAYAMNQSVYEYEPHGKSAAEFRQLWHEIRAHEALRSKDHEPMVPRAEERAHG